MPPTWVATELAGVKVFNQFATRLAKSPPDLVTHLGMVRSNAYYEAGCPLELCDHAAARDLWRVIYRDAIDRMSGAGACKEVSVQSPFAQALLTDPEFLGVQEPGVCADINLAARAAQLTFSPYPRLTERHNNYWWRRSWCWCWCSDPVSLRVRHNRISSCSPGVLGDYGTM